MERLYLQKSYANSATPPFLGTLFILIHLKNETMMPEVSQRIILFILF